MIISSLIVKNIFRFFILIILGTAALVIITPVLSFNELLYPVRIDSLYLNQQQLIYEKQLAAGERDSLAVFIYSPEQIKIHSMDINYQLRDSVTLRGWMALDTTHMQSPLLLIIPDISEGAISYIASMKQFCDRGFNVCVVNLRAQGNSEGSFYTPGATSARDIKQLVMDLQKMPFIGRIAIMGTGTGAGVAIKLMNDTSIADVLILQNPLTSLSRYFRKQATSRWGNVIMPVLPALIRSYEDKTGLSIASYNYSAMIRNINVPQLFVAANFEDENQMNETLALYKSSTLYKKQLYIDADSFRKKNGRENSKAYYDKLAAFINSSLPSKSNKTRFRRLAQK